MSSDFITTFNEITNEVSQQLKSWVPNAEWDKELWEKFLAILKPANLAIMAQKCPFQ